MTTPTVSVVIPVYNGAPWIGETLASLTDQTLTDWEAIVVDDCSPDDVAAIVAAWPDPRVRLVRLAANGGPVRARNRGVAEARGRYIAGLDQDDLCRPERLARQVAYLDAHPEVALLGTLADQLSGGRITAMTYPAHTTPALIGWLSWIENPLVWSTVMVRGEVARRLDPFTRPDILYAEDFDLYHRIAAQGAIARLDESAAAVPPARRRRIEALYRHHGGKRAAGAERGACGPVRRGCARDRAAAGRSQHGRTAGTRRADAAPAGRGDPCHADAVHRAARAVAREIAS